MVRSGCEKPKTFGELKEYICQKHREEKGEETIDLSPFIEGHLYSKAPIGKAESVIFTATMEASDKDIKELNTIRSQGVKIQRIAPKYDWEKTIKLVDSNEKSIFEFDE